MLWIPLRGLLFLAIERLDSHQAHETSDVPAADAIASFSQLIAQLSCAHERVVRLNAIHLAHQFQIGFRWADWNIVERATREFEKIGLARER